MVEVAKDHSIKWKFGEYGVPGSDLSHLSLNRFGAKADYNENLGRVLISDYENDRLLEVDYDTKDVLNEITSYESGDFYRPRAEYNPFNDNILVADRNNHYVAEIERDGTEIWSYGVYGTSGADMSHLDRPFCLSMGDLDTDRRLIADSYNHRGLLCKGTGANRQFVSYQPDAFKEVGGFWAIAASEGRGVVLLTSDGVFWHSPWASSMYVDITPEFTVLAENTFNIYEVDPRSSAPQMQPQSRRLYKDEALDGPWLPVYGMGFSELKVNAISTEADTLEIGLIPTWNDTALEVDSGSYWTDQIETYDTVSLTGNELESYIMTAPDALVCLRMTGTGTGQMWMEQRK